MAPDLSVVESQLQRLPVRVAVVQQDQLVPRSSALVVGHSQAHDRGVRVRDQPELGEPGIALHHGALPGQHHRAGRDEHGHRKRCGRPGLQAPPGPVRGPAEAVGCPLVPAAPHDQQHIGHHRHPGQQAQPAGPVQWQPGQVYQKAAEDRHAERQPGADGQPFQRGPARPDQQLPEQVAGCGEEHQAQPGRHRDRGPDRGRCAREDRHRERDPQVRAAAAHGGPPLSV